MMVFTSFDSSMIDLNRTSARAVADLKHFIEFAQRGPVALAQAVRGSVGGYDSPFEEAVANGLRRKGWHVVPQIGVSRFRIDLGIVHPDKPGDYLVGVECDGATYHSAATARDRDKVRSSILQGLGWKLLRLWSTEWWIDKEGALERLDSAIRDLLEDSRATDAMRTDEAEQSTDIRDETIAVSESDDLPLTTVNIQGANDGEISASVEVIKQPSKEPEDDDSEETAVPELKYASSSAMEVTLLAQGAKYIVNDLQEWNSRVDAERFYIGGYDETLRELIDSVVKAESPLLETTLVQRIARVHGFNRAGRLIRERVMELVDQHYHVATDHFGENFVWQSTTQQADWNTFRLPATENDIRQIDAIPAEELRALVLSIKGENQIADISRSLGIKRLTSQARQKLESLL
jgi:very-short-patch-repair endonuclease